MWEKELLERVRRGEWKGEVCLGKGGAEGVCPDLEGGRGEEGDWEM